MLDMSIEHANIMTVSVCKDQKKHTTTPASDCLCMTGLDRKSQTNLWDFFAFKWQGFDWEKQTVTSGEGKTDMLIYQGKELH